jgi:antitoxin (DNA-binding transcriptional repressor) of toxin-antitoxin stability system
MKATLTQLQRQPGKVVRPVIHGGHKLTVTAHGQACAEILPLPRIDRDAALKLLREIGPVELAPRK